MSTPLARPEPDHNSEPSEPREPGEPEERLADILQLPVTRPTEPPETAPQTRWSSAWARIVQEITPSPTPSNTPTLTFPSLRLYLPTRASLACIKPGTLIIFRSSWALARRPLTLAVALIRKPRTEEKGDEAAKETTDKKATKKKATKAETKSKTLSGDTIIGTLLLTGLGITFAVRTGIPALGQTVNYLATWATEHPVTTLRGIGLGLIVFLPTAWVVGQYVEQYAETKADPTESDTEPSEESPEHTPETAPLTTVEWVRKCIGKNRAVHLRELLLDIQKQAGGEALTMADLRAGLEAHNITIKDSVKAPASDHNGASKNRVGVHRDGLPPNPTPTLTP